MGAYTNTQFAQSDFDGAGYALNEQEGVFKGTIVCKKWGKKCNIVAFVDLDDGRKIICTTYQKPNNYLGLADIGMGKRVEIEFKRNLKGNNRVASVKQIDEEYLHSVK